ncbi:2378_t:CDS:2 [Funneliformis caledonium]|uniref:2378_t:CDS:1 n=1 Tax=Funneliformis caledonium TaxID=1117310 RepID=A0A9N9BWZ3_9GLOM|nr:2378_t:CDS:2 [Funneliformis caledonium]
MLQLLKKIQLLKKPHKITVSLIRNIDNILIPEILEKEQAEDDNESSILERADENLNEYDMNIDSSYQPSDIDDIEEFSTEEINDMYRSLFDIIEEEPLENSNILEDELKSFESFNSEYNPYFPNFTLTILFV